MKNILLLILTLLFSQSVLAQDKHGHSHKEKRIEEMRKKFITKKLSLTETEAIKFWPVYDKYRLELDALQETLKETHKKRPSLKDIENMTDKEAQDLVEQQFNKQREYLRIREKYYTEFKNVLPVKKVAMLFHTEMEFHKKLIQRLSKKHKKKESK